jgi:hypothetical protein
LDLSIWWRFVHGIRRNLALIIAATTVLTAALAGCSSAPPRGEVRGKVTFKGKPVKEGTVEFLNLDQGGAAEAPIGPEGIYEVKGGLPVGEYVVIVTPPYHLVDTDPGKTPPSMMPKPAPDIPLKFRSQDTTSLKAPVKEGNNEFDFDLVP